MRTHNLISPRRMPGNSMLRKALSWVASRLNIRHHSEEFITVVYIKSSHFCLQEVRLSTSTTVDNIKEVVAAEMGLNSTETLRVIILPYGYNWNDKRLDGLRNLDWKESEYLVKSISPKFTIRERSRSGYPRAVCLLESSIPLERLLHPWNPAHVQIFVGVENSASVAATPGDTLNQMYMYWQSQTLSSASTIRGQGGIYFKSSKLKAPKHQDFSHDQTERRDTTSKSDGVK
ncbi:hypothetical protein TWF281_003136 [Arthrobotrys megalospora]